MSNKKFVYLFSEGDASMRELLGGKGANLAEMTGLGLPVPQGFTITTEACTQYYEDGRQINADIQAEILENISKSTAEITLDPNSLNVDGDNYSLFSVDDFYTEDFEQRKLSLTETRSYIKFDNGDGSFIELNYSTNQIVIKFMASDFAAGGSTLDEEGAYAYGNFHADFIRGRVTLIGCPKLDAVDYSEKLSQIFATNNMMNSAKNAVDNAGNAVKNENSL